MERDMFKKRVRGSQAIVKMSGKEYKLQEGDTFEVILDIQVSPAFGQVGQIDGTLRAKIPVRVVSIK